MNKRKLGLNVDKSFTGINAPTESKNVPSLERATDVVQNELQMQMEMKKAEELFAREGFRYGEGGDIEGNEILGIFIGPDVKTPIQDLVRYDDSDLPYMDEQTKKDYLLYKEKYCPKLDDYSVEDNSSEIDDLFNPNK